MTQRHKKSKSVRQMFITRLSFVFTRFSNINWPILTSVICSQQLSILCRCPLLVPKRYTIEKSGLWVSMQPTCQGILCAPTQTGQCCPLHHCSHRTLTRTQSSSTLRTSSTCSLISSPILRPFLSRDDHIPKDWSTCSPPSSPLPLNNSKGLSVLTRPNSLEISEKLEKFSNLPKNFKCVYNSFLPLISKCTMCHSFINSVNLFLWSVYLHAFSFYFRTAAFIVTSSLYLQLLVAVCIALFASNFVTPQIFYKFYFEVNKNSQIVNLLT